MEPTGHRRNPLMPLSGNQTSINNPTPVSIARNPQGFILINNESVPWESFEVSNARYASAGTFRVVVPVNSLPKAFPFPKLMTTSPLLLQINAGIPAQNNTNVSTTSSLPLIILGYVDEIKYQPHTTSVIISGRDYIAKFMENKIGQSNVTPSATLPIDLETILSSTSSNVVKQLATTRGLTPIVTATTATIGKYFQNQPAMLNSQTTEWDLITFLARQEGFDVFVIGTDLYFQPKSNSSPYQITISVPYYTSTNGLPITNVEEITFTRNYRLAKNIIVTVTSWNVQDKTTYQATATLLHTETVPKDTQVYNYTIPNLTQAQCTQKATNLLQDISQHEMAIMFRMPADNLLKVTSMISVKDTNSIFDQSYYVKNITREMTVGGGFIMTVEAKNQSPYSMNVSSSVGS